MQREGQKLTHATVGVMRARSCGQRGRFPSHVFSPSAASLMSLIIIFPPSFCCLFFAGSWIICVYALLLDDSCVVGLQSVFQIRWIMNKALQQKSRVPREPCLSAPVPAWLACQPPGEGTGEQEPFLSSTQCPKLIVGCTQTIWLSCLLIY